MKKARPITLLIADDHALVRQGLRVLIEREPDLQVIAEAGNGADAVKEFIRHRPDVSVVDLHMPGSDGMTTITSIIKDYPQARLVCLTSFGGEDDVYRAMRAGAKGYVLKDGPHQHLFTCIRSVAKGQTWIAPEAAGKLAEHFTQPSLSPREMEVLRLLASAKSNKEIAVALGIAEGTVKTHITNVFKKLGVSGRLEAVNVAIKRGFIRPA
ncbi:MAG TPA: response regulator transcription factor [Terriglobia bacterium]|nr:response regulator transcription factor [Terriglobia bacterium]